MPTEQNATQSEAAPLISFIIPVYNLPEGLLRECIESIVALRLMPSEREIIVVDDGSDNNPLLSPTLYNGEGAGVPGAKATLADEIACIRQNHRGVSAARNLGLQAARGTYIQFVDGDDGLLKEAYGHVTDLLRCSRCDAVVFDFTDKRSGSTVFDDRQWDSGTALMQSENIHGAIWGYVFRRAVAGELRFTPGVCYGEDEEFTAQLLLKTRTLWRTSAKAYLYRKRPSSAIGMANSARTKSRLHRLNDMKGVIFRLNNAARSLCGDDRAALARRTAQLTMDYIYNIMATLRSTKHLERRLGELRRQGLFPLPDHPYTTKYKWFSRLTATRAGRRLMLLVLPLMRRER